MSHTPQVATPSTAPSSVIDLEGNQHRFVEVTPISICIPTAQEGLQEGAAQLDLVVLPSKTLKTLQAQITEEFNDREQIVRAENATLRQEQDDMESKYRKATAIAMQRKNDETSMRKTVAELCSELPDMQVELDGPILENVLKVIVHAKAIALRMDTVETEYKARIEELEK